MADKWRSYAARLAVCNTIHDSTEVLRVKSGDRAELPEVRAAALLELAAREIDDASDDDVEWVKRGIAFGHSRARAAVADRRYGHAVPVPVVTYFLQERRDDGGGPIKIGFSRDVAARIADLQIGCAHRIALLATTPGGRDVEEAFHVRFAADRLSGEWFRPSVALLGFITSLIEAK